MKNFDKKDGIYCIHPINICIYLLESEMDLLSSNCRTASCLSSTFFSNSISLFMPLPFGTVPINCMLQKNLELFLVLRSRIIFKEWNWLEVIGHLHFYIFIIEFYFPIFVSLEMTIHKSSIRSWENKIILFFIVNHEGSWVILSLLGIRWFTFIYSY